jgi:hypothetical protein
MQFVLTLDWVSIGASVVALLSLGASVFSAIGAARSADVARSAEARIGIGERTAALRELMRTTAKVKLEARMAILSFEEASRSAISNAACYSTPDKKRPFLLSNNEFQQKIVHIQTLGIPEITVEIAMKESDEWVARIQLELDQTLAELSGEKAWASLRAEQLTYVNRQIAEDITAAERSRGIHVRQDHNGLLV